MYGCPQCEYVFCLDCSRRAIKDATERKPSGALTDSLHNAVEGLFGAAAWFGRKAVADISSSLGAGQCGRAKPNRRLKNEKRLEALLWQLFRLHDLDGNGMLEEVELIKLNEKIAMLHHGKDINRDEVKQKWHDHYRKNFDADGEPTHFPRFREYMLQVLEKYDPDVKAQEMILEQFVAEAQLGRAVFRCDSFLSTTDAPFLSQISATEDLPKITKTIEEHKPGF